MCIGFDFPNFDDVHEDFGIDDLRDDRLGNARILFEEARQLLVDDAFDDASDLTCPELRLRLSLELRLRNLDRNDRAESFAQILARDGRRIVLALPAALAVGRDVSVQRARQCGSEADEMRAALDRVDVVGERVHRFVVGIVVLE